MYLTLPLPVSKTVSVDVVVVRTDGSAAPEQCSVDVPKTGTFKHLYQAVAEVWPCWVPRVLCTRGLGLPGPICALCCPS